MNEALLKEKEDVKNLISHLEDEYRSSGITEQSYQELKANYAKKLEDLEMKMSGGDVQEAAQQDPQPQGQQQPQGLAQVQQQEIQKPAKEEKGGILKLFGKKEPKEESGEEKKGLGKLFGGGEKKDGGEANVEKKEAAKVEKVEQKKPKPDESGMYGTGTAEDPYRSTPEVQKPEEVEVEEEKKEATSMTEIELEKLKVMIENLRGTEQSIGETIRTMSESIGELRSMVFQSDASLKELEAKVEKISDDISDVKPNEISKKFKDVSAALESAQITLEKLEKKYEDASGKINQTYDTLKNIGGIENIAHINKDMQKKLDDMKEVMRYIERLSSKGEKVFLDLNKNLEDFVMYKIKQDGLFDSVNEITKSIDALNVKLENYETKKDTQRLEEDLMLIKKQLEEINKSLPMTKLNIPEPIMDLRKDRDDIIAFLESLDEQLKRGKISLGEYRKIKEENRKKIVALEEKIKKEWVKILPLLQPAENKAAQVEEPAEENKETTKILKADTQETKETDNAEEKPAPAAEEETEEPAENEPDMVEVQEPEEAAITETENIPVAHAAAVQQDGLTQPQETKEIPVEVKENAAEETAAAVQQNAPQPQETKAAEVAASPLPQDAIPSQVSIQPPAPVPAQAPQPVIVFNKLKKAELISMIKGVKEKI